MSLGPRRRALLATAVMVAGAGGAVLARPTKHLADQLGMPNLEVMFPTQFGEWRIDSSMPVILPAPNVQAMLDKIYNQTLARTYVNPRGQRVMLSVAYGGDQSDGTSAHRPEACYPAQGFAITANRAVVLSMPGRTLPARTLMAKMGSRHEPITYWVVVGDKVVTTGIGQKLAQMRYGVRGTIADGMLVRVSNIDVDMAQGAALNERFIVDLAASLHANTVQRVFGDGRS